MPCATDFSGASGGLDSILLLTLLTEQVDCKLIQAVHINHGLSDNADQWQQFTQDYCRSWVWAIMRKKFN